MHEQTIIFDRKINLVNAKDLDLIAAELACSASQTVLFCNVHMLMLSQEDSALATAMDSSNWVFADGVPVAWLQRRITHKNAEVIRGYELMSAICERASILGEKIGFIGSTQNVMDKLTTRLSQKFKGLEIAYHLSPPFVLGELVSSTPEIKEINDTGIKWLFVGLGCPKQEKWIERHKTQLDCHVLGVGAAFDWVSGTTKKPPDWMERSALAWLYRLFQNPTKMAHRYFRYNSKFILKSIPFLLKR